MRAALTASFALSTAALGVALFSARPAPAHGGREHVHGPHGHTHGAHGHAHGAPGHAHAGGVPELAAHADLRLLALPAPGADSDQNTTRQAVAEALVDHDFRRALAAAEAWVRAGRFDPWTLMAVSDAHLELGELDAAETTLQRVLDVKPTAPTYFRAAYLLHLRGRDADAISALELAVESTPRQAIRERAWTLTELGDVQRFAGELAAAEASYRRALSENPRWSGARVGLARCARARGELSLAAELLREAEAKPSTLSELALLERALDQPQRAQRTLQEALALGRSDDHYARMLAHALADHGVDTAEAVALARHELIVRPNAHTWDALAHALWADGQSAAALSAARRALSWGTQEPELLFHAGLAAAASGEREQARAWLSEAYRRDPGLTWHPQALALDTL
ncbi:MAG: tetratricopeptide repeat protein [Planctomycetes bacterium]|nr:tetratricopeptide repeat protein [Planctomycetota bacterium]